MIPCNPPPRYKSWRENAQDIIRHYEWCKFTEPKYVTEDVRQEIFVRYKNRVLRCQFYEFVWEDMGGGVWKIADLKYIEMHR